MYWCSLSRRVTAHKVTRSPRRVHRPRRPHHRPPEALTLLAVARSSSCSPASSVDPSPARCEDSGGFTATDSGSARAVERIEAATGTQAAPGVVALLRTPSAPSRRRRPRADRRGAADARRRARDRLGRSVATTRDPRFVSRDGRATYLAATLDADADEDAVVAALAERFADADDVVLGGSLVAGSQIGDSVDGRPGPRRGARVPDPAAPLAPLLPRPRRRAAARGRDHDRARHASSSLAGDQPGLRALDLRAQPGHRPRARPGDRLHAVPGHPLPRGARAPGPGRRRGAHDDEHRRAGPSPTAR